MTGPAITAGTPPARPKLSMFEPIYVGIDEFGHPGRSTLKWPHCSLLIWPHLEQCGARSSPLIWPHLGDRGVDLCDTPGRFQGAGSV
jgi:hypothetical protein